jgi:hypothetical protein
VGECIVGLNNVRDTSNCDNNYSGDSNITICQYNSI